MGKAVRERLLDRWKPDNVHPNPNIAQPDMGSWAILGVWRQRLDG